MTRSGPGAGRRALTLTAAAAALVIGTTAAAPALAQAATYEFSIPAEPMGSALKTFGETSNTQILFAPALVQGRRSPPVQGRLTSDQALVQLLRGSGLTYQRTASNVVLIKAQEAAAPPAPQPAPATETASVEEVVVVGTPGGAGINKLDASFAVTTVNPTDIQQASPKSTADLLKLVPGVWAETSGGVSGANIFVRGFPATGDAEFVTFQLQGAPIYPPPTLSFLENSTLFRVDETIQGMEALRGGPNPIFSNGQPGLTANFRLKEGGDDFAGLVKASTSDYGLKRADFLLSGPLGEDFHFMIGGYARSSHGVRDTEFESEVGQQFTVNLTKRLERGKINLYARLTDDHGAWYLPLAVNVPGIDKGTYTQLGQRTRYRTLQVNAAGDTKTFDFAKGRGWEGLVAGGSFEHEFGDGWVIRDRFSFTKGDADTYGLVPDGGAIPATALVAVIGGPVTTRGGQALGAGDFVQNWGHWVVQKDIKAVVNDLSISREIAGHQLALGYYAASFSSDDFWTLGNFIPMHVRSNGDLLAAGITCGQLATAGSGSGCWAYGIRSGGDARVDAVYAADSWQITEALRLDLGVRYENFETDYAVDAGPGYPSGGAPVVTDYDKPKLSYTAGVNYQLNAVSGVFARYSSGVKFPSFDNFRESVTDVLEVDQYELGYKYSGGPFDLFVTGFANRFKGAAFLDVGGTREINTNEAYGVELDGRWRTDFGLSVTLNGTFQKTEITESSIPGNVGNEAQRQPEWQLRVTPSYDISIGDVDVTLYGTFSAVGDRFANNENTSSLPGYEKLDLGAIVNLGDISLQVAVDNVTDEAGLTEGDPRSAVSANARPIFGRSVVFSVGYRF